MLLQHLSSGTIIEHYFREPSKKCLMVCRNSQVCLYTLQWIYLLVGILHFRCSGEVLARGLFSVQDVPMLIICYCLMKMITMTLHKYFLVLVKDSPSTEVLVTDLDCLEHLKRRELDCMESTLNLVAFPNVSWEVCVWQHYLLRKRCQTTVL